MIVCEDGGGNQVENDASVNYAVLLEYVGMNGRLCPQPMVWNRLWEMLLGRHRVGLGWEPALPLILGAWWDSTGLEKNLRFLEYLQWAYNRGCLKAVDSYLRSIGEGEWFHTGD